MKITTKTDYAVVILTSLAKSPQKAVSLAAIAQSARISEAYLQRIAARLKRKGLIKPKHGAFGGYYLNRPAETITMLDVINGVGDQTAAVRCTAAEKKPGEKCPHCDDCDSKDGWERFQVDLNNLFAQATIADMIK